MLGRLLLLIVVLTAAITAPTQAQRDAGFVDRELAAAGRSVAEGRVAQGLERLADLFRGADPVWEADAVWQAGQTLVELLTETENSATARRVLDLLAASKVPEAHLATSRWMQFYVGRNLFRLGKADEAINVLRPLTGGDARLVRIPAQRAAAIVLSRIELERGNVSQSAIWMRRAVIGTLVDKGAGSDEIVDVLTEYASYLNRTRRLPEAYYLFRRLAPIYEAYFPPLAPKHLRFLSWHLNALTSVAEYKTAEVVYETLRDRVAGVDVVASSVREEVFFQELYQLARRSSEASGQGSISERLKQIVSTDPDFLKEPRNRIVFAYFALIANDVDLADQFNATVRDSVPSDAQFTAYETILRSYVAARRGAFGESIALVRSALSQIHLFHRRYENESSSRLPFITIEERLVLSHILGHTVPHASTPEQIDTLFRLQQYLNRDKAKLGVNAGVARHVLGSDLQREEMRTRDLLRELRDRIMEEAADTLLARVLPLRAYRLAGDNDYALLARLEEIEDKIAGADEQLRRGASASSDGSGDAAVDLATIQQLLRPDEALVLHAVAAGAGMVTTCIESTRFTYYRRGLDRRESQQFLIDIKLLSAAVRGSHQPSAALDSAFPSDSSHRLYQILLGGLEACLRNKKHILLATDTELFSLPWNALLTRAPANDGEFRHRSAAWLAKSYALSLLPSARSLRDLRERLRSSRAGEKFLGIGAPDFNRAPDPSLQLSLGPLFAARGIADRAAIAELPRLPESAEELRVIAEALGATGSHMLLGQEAAELELRKRPLHDYKVISFATHAVVAGEFDGVAEPALVLTPGPDDRMSKNDGLLTASEIADLTLDANLVILSACNTAAPDGSVSGYGLSGLVDAFFFAGARAVAATQWAVFSDAAKQLGSGLISHSSKSRAVGVAEGLRRTMVDYISEGKDDHLAHPRFWAAFVIAGDGAVRPLD